jgi:DNA invertase Pin-like site-specific DNA recombinase
MAYKPYRFSDLVRSMYESGISVEAIAFKLKLKIETVKKWCGLLSSGSD